VSATSGSAPPSAGASSEGPRRHGRILCDCGWSLLVNEAPGSTAARDALHEHQEEHLRAENARAWDALLPAGPGLLWPAEG
jgi:hypothetical protein